MAINIGCVTNNLEIELPRNAQVKPKQEYEKGRPTGRQESDERGLPVWAIRGVGFYDPSIVASELIANLVIHSKTEPVLPNTGNHPQVELVSPYIRAWNSSDGIGITIHCDGIKAVKAGEK
ncbi:MAG: hypothetical protein E7Z99_03320 [Coriobacteriaceae bacterium]|nr:hypothetical protein [Coriobacteriaceae bacterium]